VVAAVLAMVVTVGIVIGNNFFWKPADERSIETRKYDQIERVFRQNPGSKSAALAYAISLYDKGQNEEADENFKVLIEKFPKDTAVLINYGLFKKETGDIKEAKASFEKVLKNAPYFVIANVQYGILLREEGSYSEALKKFDNAIKIEPGSADILVEKAKVYIAMKDTKKASELLNKALTFVPDYKEAEDLLNQLK